MSSGQNLQWTTLPLIDVATLQRGFDLPVQNRTPGEVPIFAANGPVGWHHEAKVLAPGVVTGRSGSIGKVHYVDRDYWPLNTSLFVKDFHGNHPRFIYYLLQQMRLEGYCEGTGVPTLNRNNVHSVMVDVPLLEEQQRIAGILDRADELRAKRRAGLAQLDEFPHTIFLDMFGDPAANAKGWPLRSLGDLIVDGPQNGLYKPSADYGTGTPILRIDAFYDGVITDLSGLKRVRLSEGERTGFRLTEDDVIINRVNSLEYLGKCALVPSLLEETVFESNMMRMRFDLKKCHPRFVVQFLQSGFAKSQIQMRAKHAVNQASINQQDVKGFQMGVPPIELQREFARRVTAVETLKTAHRASLAELDALFASLQHRAFRGEL